MQTFSFFKKFLLTSGGIFLKNQLTCLRCACNSFWLTKLLLGTTVLWFLNRACKHNGNTRVYNLYVFVS